MRFLGFSFCFGLFLSVQSVAQSDVCQKANQLVAVINKHHIQPVPVNDEWSKRVLRSFLSTLDPERLMFTQEDISTLLPYETQLDDLLSTDKCDWLPVITKLYTKRIQYYKTWVEQTLSKPLEFKQGEFFDANAESDDFAKNAQELELKRKQYIKYELLMRMYQESLMESPQKPLLSHEVTSRQKIKEREVHTIQHAVEEAGGIDKLIANSFYKALSSVYDPHTEYFSYEEAEDFKSELNLTQLSFGFSIKQNQIGNMIISSIIPGSPAWVSNDLHNEDILLSLETTPNKIINTMDYSIEEIWDMISSSSVLTATFIVKRPDGEIKRITLTKEKLESTENVVDGFLLKGAKNIGYIPLPSFYFDWNENSGVTKGSATDMAKTIIKLNKEKLDGLILDLRFNGGGSVQEALDLAGIFIDYGPLIFFHVAGKPIETIKDMNKGTIYNGPLIIMVNGLSASASELLASTLQDYNRALVVGTKTFGKGTGQEMIAMNPRNPKSDILKITSSKIYRINGKMYQHKGVIPSIVLPDLTTDFSEKESDYSYALPSDSIVKKTYFTPLPSISVSSLTEKSSQRINQSEAFKEIESLRNILSKPVPLNPKDFENYLNTIVKYHPHNNAKNFTVTSTRFDDSLLKVDAFKKAQNEKLLKEVESSFYIQEAYNIMIDYVSQKK